MSQKEPSPLTRFSDLEDKRSADAVLQVSAKVNRDLFNRLRGEEDMCEALREIMAEDLMQAENKGLNQGLNQGIAGSVEILRSVGVEEKTILEKIMEQYDLSEEKAMKYMKN